MLSANLASIGTGAAAFGGLQSSHVAHEVVLETGAPQGLSSTFVTHSAAPSGDIFAGLEAMHSSTLATTPAGQNLTSAPAAVPASDSTAATTPTATEAHAETTQVRQSAAIVSTASANTAATTSAAKTLSVTSVSDTSSKVRELTTTLKGANGPPASALTSQDLTSYISDLLAAASGSFTKTQQLGSASVGGVLELTGVQISVTATLTNGTWSGSVAITATSATLFPGKSFSAAIASTTADPAITGTYTIGGAYSLTVPTTATLTLKVGEALTITASNVGLAFDPNAAANQTIATIHTATVSSSQFSGMPTATLGTFALRQDGFSFDSFTLTSAPSSTPSIGNLVTTTGATLTASAVNVTYGFGTTAASLTGTVGLTLTGVHLYPAGGVVTFQATSVTAAYDFGTFDGTSATGQLTMTIKGLKLQVGEALLVSTSSDVILTPGQATIATIASATLSSPQFTGLGTLTVTNLQLLQTGFSLGSADWKSAGAVSIGDFVTATSLTVSLANVTLVYGTNPGIGGTLSVSATGVVLFPNIPVLNLQLGSLAGSYHLGDTLHPAAFLSLHIPTLDIPLGDALTIHLGAVDITPGGTTMVHVTGATVSANLFTGLPTFNLGTFDLTQNGFSLGSFSITLGSAVTIGSFLSVSSATITVTNFSVDKTQTPVIGGSIAVTLGTVTLFPGTTIVTSSFTNVQGKYDFASATHPGQFSFSADTISLSIASQLAITANLVTFTPGLPTIATIGTATLTFAPLNGLVMTLNGLTIGNTGFSIASATTTFSTDLTLGSLLSLGTPTVTLTNINYVLGGSLTGTVGFDTPSAKLHLGSALDTSASHLSGSYNLATGVLTVTMDNFGLDLAGFATLTGTGATLTYAPATDGSAQISVAATGLEAFLGTGTGSSRVGIDLTGGSFGLVVFKASGGGITYALDVKGSVALLGMPANSISVTTGTNGTVEFRKNTAGAVSTTVATSSGTVNLNFTGNETSVQAQGLSLSVGTFLTVKGNFAFSQFTSGTNNYLAIAASSVNASVGAGGVAVSLTGASLSLLVQAATGSTPTQYALVATGGTASLTGVPDLSFSAANLTIRVRSGLDASTVTGLPTSLTTSDGGSGFDLSGLGTGAGNLTDIQGTLTLAIANFVSITGHFGFQEFTDNGATYLAIGATGLNIVLGTSSTNLTLKNASLGLIIAPGTGGAAATYALEAKGSSNAADTSLNGVGTITLNASNLLVRVRKGLNVSGDPNIPTTVHTSGGDVTLDFTGLGSGTTDVVDIEGHVTLNVPGFGSLDGDFGFQSFADTKAGTQDIAIGAMNATIVLGTSTTNVTVTGATFGMVIRPGAGTTPTAYAVSGSATAATLNGAGDLGLSVTSLLVRIRSGFDMASASGIPTTIHTSGGDVAISFAGLGTGSGNLADIEGNLTLTVGTFVSLQGSFGIQSYTVNTDHYLAIGATGITATMTAGSVSLTIAKASLGVIVKQGAPSGYILEARGSSNPADTALTGIPDFTLNASNLLVRARSGLDVSTLPSSIPTSIHTPGGDVTFDFSGLGTGSGAVTDIEGHLTLSVKNFVSLEGDFGFQKFADGTGSAIAIGAANVNAVLGTSTMNVTVAGASLGILIKPSVGYDLIATGGTDTLNGIPDLSVSASGFTVKVRKGLDPATLTSAPSSVQVSGGTSVSLAFAGLGSGDVTAIMGTVDISVANFATLHGTFSFTQQKSGTVTKILVGATDVQAFVGIPGTLGVNVSGASFGLVIYRDSTANGSTYALQATAPTITAVGLPSEITLNGSATVAINTTGAAVSETIPGIGTTVSFTDGTNIKSFGGSLTLGIGSVVTLTGNFSFSKVVSGNVTKLMVGATNVGTAVGTTVTADGSTNTFNLSNGTLGLVFFNTGGTNQGYAMTASATATVAVGTALTGSATLTIRRNTTTAPQNENVVVGSSVVPVVFGAGEFASGSPLAAFQKIVLSNASLSLDNTLIITAAQATQTTPTAGASSTPLTGVTLTLQNPSGQALFSITAGTATYTSYSGTVTSGSATGAGLTARGDGSSWVSGDKDLVLTSVTFSIGTYASFTATTIDVQHYTSTTLGTVNRFNFNGATITIFANGKSMVSLTGSPIFEFSSTAGFNLISFASPGFSFMGQTLSAKTNTLPAYGQSSGTGGTQGTYADSSSTYSLGPITLTSPGVSLDGFQFQFANSSPTGTVMVNLTATVHITAASAAIGASTSPTHASITNLDGSFAVTLGFDLLHLTAAPTGSVGAFNIKASQVQIAIGNYVTLTATDSPTTPLQIHPDATASQDLISIGSLTASLVIPGTSINISGTASNFAIEGDGSFLAKPGFAVSLSLGTDGSGNADASGFSWPSWLPLKSAAVTLAWANFNADPTHFVIELSASVDLSSFQGIPLKLSGSVTNLVIDPSLVSQGKFPITAVGSISVSVKGNMFGGTVDGTLIAGVVRFDSAGHTVDPLGYIQGTTTLATGTITSAFYAGIQAGFTMGGEAGFNIMIGLSDYGPLQIFVEADIAIPLGDTGLFISNLRGGITFGASFPTITLSNPIQASDALQLRNASFSSPTSLTAAQWEAQLQAQVAHLVLTGAAKGGWASLASGPFIVQAGVTIYAGSADAFRVDGDIFFDTTGKFLVIGSATVGNSLSINVKFFADMSKATTGVTLLFLMEVPTPGGTSSAPIYSLYGVTTLSYTNNIFKISIAGAADFNLFGAVTAHAEATLTLSFSSTSFNMTLVNASLTIPTIQSDALGTASGTITIQSNTGGGVDIWGGLLLVPNLHGLQSMGIYAGGQLYIKINTTDQAQLVTLSNGSLTLDPHSFSLFVNGHVDFKISNQQVFEISGTLTMEINSDSLTIFVNATLLLGPNPASPLLTFNANGLIYVQVRGTIAIPAGFAAKITLTMGGSVPNGISFAENWILVVNTTGVDITFTIPAPVATNPPSPPIATVMGPDFSSSNPLALTSYEVVTGGVRTLVIPNGAPASGLSSYQTWTPAIANSAYFIIVGRGSLTVASSFTLTGTLNIIGAVGASSFLFRIDANANLNVQSNGNTVFSFHVGGGIQIGNDGVAAVLNISLNGGVPSGLGFSISNATFLLELNTTANPVTLGGIQVPTGPGNLFARIHISGDLTFLGGIIDLNGSFDLTVTGTSLTLAIDANITFFNATLHASGFAGIYYDSHPGLALRIQLSLPGGAEGLAPVKALGSQFVIKGTFTLELNTCSIARNDQYNVPIQPGFKIAVTNIGVYLFGFNLTGSLSISITSAGFAIDIQNLTLNLFNLATISLSGYYHPDGSFSFTGSASFQLGDHSFGIGGSISVTISNSGFSASVSGWVAAFGVEISGGGSIDINTSTGEVTISVWIYVVLIPAVHIHTDAVVVWGVTIWPAINIDTDPVVVSGTATFHLGTTAPPPAIPPAAAPPPPPPTPPALAGVNNGVLTLYLGSDVNKRVNTTGTLTGAQTSENYVLTAGADNHTVVVSALGFTQTYTGVNSVLVTNTLDGNDTITVDNAIVVPVNMTLGTGNNTITTGSGAATVAITGSGTNQLTTGNSASITVTGGGNNHVSTGSNSTVTISGNGANQVITNGGSAPINVTGTGSNGITINNGYAGTVTIGSTASGNNTVSITNGTPTVTVNGGGRNKITVNSSSSRTISINGGGNNTITSSGAGATTLTIAGNGANSVVIGGGSATITVSGNGPNNITTGGGAASVYLRGSGGNTVYTGAGFATIKDQGTGGNAIHGGTGGGLYVGGVDQNGNIFSTKAPSSVSAGTGAFSIQVSGYATYSLTDYALKYGAFSLSLFHVHSATLTAGTGVGTSGSDTFALLGWTGSASLTGKGDNNSFLTVPGATVASLNYVLTDTKLTVTGGVTQTITLSGIAVGDLVGASSGNNTYDVSGWTGAGSLRGPQGTTNTLIATNDVATFTLSDTSFGRSGGDTLTLVGIQAAILTGGASANTFNVSSWSGNVSLDGAGSGDTYNLTLSGAGTGTFVVSDSGTSGTDTVTVNGAWNLFVTATQVRVGTQRVTYSGIEALNVNGSANGLSYFVQSTNSSTTTTVHTGGATSSVIVSSTAGAQPASAGVLTGIQGPLSIAGGGTLLLDNTGATTAQTGTLTPTAFTGFGMGAGGIHYQDVSTLTIKLGSGGNTLAINDINAATYTVVDGGSSANDTVNASFAGDFNGRLDLTSFEHGTVAVAGNFNGRLNDSGPGHLETVTIASGGSLSATGRLNAGSIDTLSIGQDLAGIVNVTGTLGNLSVGHDLSGTVTESGVITQVTIGHDLTGTGVITASNATPALGGIGAMSVGNNLAGKLTVSGSVTSLAVGGNLSGVVAVGGTLGTLKVTGDVSGSVSETGTIALLTIGGSLTATGSISVSNSADPAQLGATPVTTHGNITTMVVGQNLAGSVLVTGNLDSLTVGTAGAGNVLSGTVTVQGTLTALTVNGDVSGTVSESGTVASIGISGSLLPTGLIKIFNSADPSGMLANITAMTVGLDVAGKILVSGQLAKLTIGRDVSGAITEAGTVNLLTIAGSLTSTGMITVSNPTAANANIVTLGIGANLAGTVAVTGNLTTATVGGNLSGVVLVQGALANLSVSGDVSGAVTESGTIASLAIGGSLTSSGRITAKNTADPAANLANISTMTVGADLAGAVLVTGTLSNLSVGHDVSGSVTEAGTINLLAIGGSLTVTGVITAFNAADPLQVPAVQQTTLGNINAMNVGHDLAGKVAVSGTFTTLTVGGNLSGTVTVQGALTTVQVGGDVSGKVTETGTIKLFTIGGSLTSTGVITAYNSADPLQVQTSSQTSSANASPLIHAQNSGQGTLGNIVTLTITHDLAGAVTVSGTFTTLTVGGSVTGTVTVQGALTTAQVGGNVSGTIVESGTINLLTIGGSLTQTGLIKAVNTNATLANMVTLTIGQDFAGTIIVSGNLHSLSITNGSMTTTAQLTVGSLDLMTIGPDQLSIGQNLAGVITVTGTLQSLRVAGGTPGKIIVGHIGTIAVYGGFGPVVLDVIENGVERHIEIGTAATPYPHPNSASVATTTGKFDYVNVQFFYESGSLANPQLTARITNGASTARDQYDFSLVTYSDTAKFNLARLDAAGVSGIRNVVVEGDLLTSVSSQAAAFFKLVWPSANPTLDPTPAGIRLSKDDIAGVSIRDYAPNGFIQAHSIQAVAFGSFTDDEGRIETGASAEAHDAQRLLTPDTALVAASDTFRVAFADQATQAVGFFVVTDSHDGHFDEENVAFTVQSVVTANAAGTGNVTTPSNVARGAATALVTVVPTTGHEDHEGASVIQTIAIRGDGASISTKQWIAKSITSTGPLGDLDLENENGITDITAPSIFGSITGAPIIGTIQTTGLRTDPITDVVTKVSGDLGRVYVSSGDHDDSPALTTSTIEAHSDISGRIIVRGNLISSVEADGGISGTIAVSGNLGVAVTTGGTTIRLSGIVCDGRLTGAIVILGDQIADVTLHGMSAGVYAVKGNVVGNLSLSGSLDSKSVVVSAGRIGDPTLKTALTTDGDNKGIIAAVGAILFSKKAPKGYVFSSTNAANTAMINAIFTNNGAALALDVTGQDLQGLTLILADLHALKVVNGSLSGPTP